MLRHAHVITLFAFAILFCKYTPQALTQTILAFIRAISLHEMQKHWPVSCEKVIIFDFQKRQCYLCK